MPAWLQIGQSLLTPLIAIVVAWIAFMQWRTARSKLIADLFDRRFAVYMDFRQIVSEVTQLGKLTDQGMPNEVIARGRFLFGQDVQRELQELHRLVVLHETGDVKASQAIRDCFERAQLLFTRYMEMDRAI